MTVPNPTTETPGPRSFVAELKRRKVVRVGIAYVGLALGMLQVADLVFSAFFFDDAVYGVLVIATVASIPVVLVLAWIFDITPRGVERTPDEAPTDDGANAGSPAHPFTGQLLVAGAVVILAMAGIGWRFMPNDHVDLVKNRIAVLPFENLTGDAELDVMGVVAADYIANWLLQADGFESVALNESRRLLAAPEDPAPEHAGLTSIQRVSQGTKAAVVVTGSYTASGNDIVFQATAYDAAKEEALYSTDPIRTHRDDPLADFELMREDLFGFVGMLGERLEYKELGALQTRVPTYAAYRQFAVAHERFLAFDWRGAAAAYEEAADLDSTFARAVFQAAVSHFNAGELPEAARLVERLESMRADITEGDRVALDWIASLLRGDLQGAYTYAVRGHGMAGVSSTAFLAGSAAMGVNRPAEAIELFKDFDLERVGPLWPAIWGPFAAAYHTLGRHGTELRLIRRGRAQRPEDQGIRARELAALAARGKGAELWEHIDDFDLGGLGDVSLWQIADELEVHGDPDRASELRARILTRQESASAEERQSPRWTLFHGMGLVHAGRDDEAGAIFRPMLEADPDDPSARYWPAVLAARRGDRAAAEEAIEFFGARQRPYQRGRNVLRQAWIAAELGDAERAVRFLRQAEERGATEFERLHASPAYRSIRDQPAFQAYMKPRG